MPKNDELIEELEGIVAQLKSHVKVQDRYVVVRIRYPSTTERFGR